MAQGKRGKKPASSEMPEDSPLLEEDDLCVDPIEELEEATADSRTFDEFFRSFFGTNAEIDYHSETTGINPELLIDRAEPASTGMQDISFAHFRDSFNIDDESERDLLSIAGLKTTRLGPEETSGVVDSDKAIAPAMYEAKSIGSFDESLDDGDAKEMTKTAGLKTTGLKPEQLSGSVNRGEGVSSGWQEANPSTELQLGRQLSAPRQIPVQAVLSRLRMKKEFARFTERQLTQMVYQGLLNKNPILPSTDSILETRVPGTYKVPKTRSPRGTGRRRGPYRKKPADEELLKPHAQTSTANGGESISISFKKETLPRFKEIILFVSRPQVESEVSPSQAGSEDAEEDSSTVKKLEDEKEVMSGMCVLSDSSRPHRLTRFFNLISRISMSRRQSEGR